MSDQLPLSLQLRESASFANFVAAENAETLARLQRIAQGGASDGAVYLWGVSGTGKSHLLQSACREAAELGVAVSYIPLADHEQFDPKMLDGLESLGLVCIDDLHCVAGDPAWEEALFHLFNRAFELGTPLVFSANVNIAALGLGLADLASRLSWGFVFHLHPLSDENKIIALQRRANERGLGLPENVGQFLLRRCPRDMTILFENLEQLDMAALAAQRRLTVPFVREWLEGQEAALRQGSLF